MAIPTPTDNGKQVLVYSKPSCTACTNVKRWLTARSIPFMELDITTDENIALAKIRGIASAPMVVIQPAGAAIEDDSQAIVFSGFRPDVLQGQFPDAATTDVDVDAKAA